MKSVSRRSFFSKALLGTGGLLATNLAPGSSTHELMDTNPLTAPKVIFFDVNETLLDLTPLKESVTKALGGKKDLVTLWFTTMLQYSLVATVGDQYRDFGDIGAATLQMVARNNDISLSEEKAKAALKPIQSLPAHKDVPEALASLKQAGYRLVTLTNSSNKGVEAQMTNSGLKQYFEKLLSVEDVGLYKPHSRVYTWASRKMEVRTNESMMIAAHGWDVAGARWAGWKTAFIARPGQQLYPLAETPELVAPTLTEIAKVIVSIKR
jgi:2-haloacid dehalogenase